MAESVLQNLSVLERPITGSVWSLELGDLDDDGVEELLTSGGPPGGPEPGLLDDAAIDLYKVDSEGQLKLWLKVPYERTLDDLKVGDLDGDGMPEIVQVGNHRRIVVYERATSAGGIVDFVQSWESEELGAFTQGLAVADISPSPGDEIVAGTITIRGTEPASGRLVAYEVNRDAEGVLRLLRVLDAPAQPALIHGLSVGDLTGDGQPEIVLNGRIVYWIDPSTQPWGIARVDTVSLAGGQVNPGDLFLERGPAAIVPSLPVGALSIEGQSRWVLTALPVEWRRLPSANQTGLQGRVCVEIENVWSESEAVQLQLTCSSPGVSIAKSEIVVPALPSSASYTSEDAFEIALAGGHSEGALDFVVHRMQEGESSIRYHFRIPIPDPDDLPPTG
ncbi:FG-GAP repeat domain-containing protein [Gemmatimonadota bacterium]